MLSNGGEGAMWLSAARNLLKLPQATSARYLELAAEEEEDD